MASLPFWRATALGSALQAAMVLLGLVLPTLREENLYPIGGTLLALLTGVLYARWRRGGGAPLPGVLWGGAVAAGLSSLLGMLLAALTAQAVPGSAVLVAGVTGWVAGAVGAGLGRMLTRRVPSG
jgi:hypothetical protein